MNAVETLVHSTVDYAGLFPPAKLSLEAVVKNYASYQNENRRGMLARLIVPASRLVEFETVCDRLSIEPDSPWEISALVPSIETEDEQLNADDFINSMNVIDSFNQRQSNADRPIAIVDTIEVKTFSTASTQAISQHTPDSINAFLEIEWQNDPDASIAAIQKLNRTNLYAKIRSGGIQAKLIPSAEQVARFLIRCAQREVGLKATAGLHHPLRGNYRLTYEPDAEFGTMHGFVNVFVAACLAFGGKIADIETLARVIASDSAQDFILNDDAIGFQDLKLEQATIAKIRQSSMISFGSCSFDEPSVEVGEAFQLAAI